MTLLAEHPYVKVEKIIRSISKEDKTDYRTIYLYEDKVVTKHRTIPIEQVRDMTYRKLGKLGGLLYVHTTQGVFSYTVYEDPQNFIDAYKKHIKGEYTI